MTYLPSTLNFRNEIKHKTKFKTNAVTVQAFGTNTNSAVVHVSSTFNQRTAKTIDVNESK